MRKQVFFFILLWVSTFIISCGKKNKESDNKQKNNETAQHSKNNNDRNDDYFSGPITGASNIEEFRKKILKNEVRMINLKEIDYQQSEIYILYCDEEINRYCSKKDIRERILNIDGTVLNNPFGTSRDEIKNNILNIIDKKSRSLKFSNTRYSIRVSNNDGGEDEYLIDIAMPLFMNPISIKLSHGRDSYIPANTSFRYK